ncbi:M42 family metallopeptidase [Paenibacillus humicola]|uniref:M42 family metallopeptidase n=1 Tax=Paenibacillus humicola TaxID=3110540 RepID=UPI00237A25F5|nr:M42 family metallopeptidase [Paenibacillus humicola]
MKEKVNRSYVHDLMERILLTPSPTGYCRQVIELLRVEAEKLGMSGRFLQKGGLIIDVPGTAADKTIGITGHVDTLGAIVRSIKPSGTLRLSPVGGYMMNSIEGEYCSIHTRGGDIYSGTILTTKPSVHVFSDARDQKREEAVMEVRIDERVSSEQEVKALGIRPGDFISFDPRFRSFGNGFVKSRHLDDKAGVAAMFGTLELISRGEVKPLYPLKFIFSNYEEVGHGTSSIPSDISEMIAVDMGAIGDDLNGTEYGVSICAKDSSGPYDYDMTSRLIELAERDGIGYAVDIYPHYGSDASAALRGGNDIRAACLGPGVSASHGMERTHMDAVVQTAALLALYVSEG